jgi:hypothetical protein
MKNCMRDARAHPGTDLEERRRAGELLWREAVRSPDVGLGAREVEAVRHHADDVGLDAIEPHRPADDLRIAGETALPEVVAQDSDRCRAAVAIFIGREQAASNRPNAEHVPHRGGESHPLDALSWCSVFRRAQVHGEAEIRADRLERPRLFLPRQIVRAGHAAAHRGPIDE